MFRLFCIALGIAIFFTTNFAMADKGKWLEEWKNAKKEFEKTGFKKPGDSGKIFGVTYRKSAGLENAMKSLDNTYKSVDKKHSVGNLKSFEKAAKDYFKLESDYINTVLKKYINMKLADFNAENKTNITQEELGKYQTGLQNLQKKLKDIKKEVELSLIYYQSRIAPVHLLPKSLADMKKEIVKTKGYIEKAKPLTSISYLVNISPGWRLLPGRFGIFTDDIERAFLNEVLDMKQAEDIFKRAMLYVTKKTEPKDNAEAQEYVDDLNKIIQDMETWVGLAEQRINEVIK